MWLTKVIVPADDVRRGRPNVETHSNYWPNIWPVLQGAGSLIPTSCESIKRKMVLIYSTPTRKSCRSTLTNFSKIGFLLPSSIVLHNKNELIANECLAALMDRPSSSTHQISFPSLPRPDGWQPYNPEHYARIRPSTTNDDQRYCISCQRYHKRRYNDFSPRRRKSRPRSPSPITVAYNFPMAPLPSRLDLKLWRQQLLREYRSSLKETEPSHAEASGSWSSEASGSSSGEESESWSTSSGKSGSSSSSSSSGETTSSSFTYSPDIKPKDNHNPKLTPEQNHKIGAKRNFEIDKKRKQEPKPNHDEKYDYTAWKCSNEYMLEDSFGAMSSKYFNLTFFLVGIIDYKFL